MQKNNKTWNKSVQPDQEEQQSLPSSTCLTSRPMNHEPTLTSSCAYVRRIDLFQN